MNKFRYFLFFSILLVFSNCSAPKVKISDIPKMPNTVEGIKYPELKSRFDNNTLIQLQEFKQKNGAFETVEFTFETPIESTQVEQFYDRELQKIGFVGDVPKRVNSGDATIFNYTKNNFLNNEKLAIFFVALESYETKNFYHFLLICKTK